MFFFVTQKAPPMDLFSPRYVWHSSPKDICPLGQHCGWGITGLAATGDFETKDSFSILFCPAHSLMLYFQALGQML